MNEIRIGKFIVPDISKFELAGDSGQDESNSHRRSLYTTLAALFVDSEGLIRYDFMPALTGVWCLFARTEEYVLSLLADLRTLGYIQRTEWQDAPFRLVNEAAATASVREEAEHKRWLASRKLVAA
jgi:hypothetical protein